MKVTARIKKEIVDLTDALHNFSRGDLAPAIALLHLGELPPDKIKYGLTERLKNALAWARANGKRIPASVYNMADRVLADANKTPNTEVVFSFKMVLPVMDASDATSVILPLQAQFVAALMKQVPGAEFHMLAAKQLMPSGEAYPKVLAIEERLKILQTELDKTRADIEDAVKSRSWIAANNREQYAQGLERAMLVWEAALNFDRNASNQP